MRKVTGGQQGFTLLEILVVLTIMGFLIAMVAPRLAGVSSTAVDTVCDSNQNRMVSMLSSYFEQTNRFPNKLTNLVEELDEAEAYQIPAVSDDDPENGPETLASEFMSRNHFRIHYLNDAELAELRDMGITTVLNLNAYDWLNDARNAAKTGYDATAAGPNDVALTVPTTIGDAMEEMTLPTDTDDERFAVAMVGMGAKSEDDEPTFDVHTGERGWGEPDWFGRIILGFGPENGLVTTGIVANAAHCPGGIQNADNVTYNDYNLVLPRLAATVERMDAGTLTGFTADPEALEAVAYDDAPAADYDIAANDDNLKVRTFNIAEAQESWQYATQCPEGHMFPADDEEFWAIDIGGTDGEID
jgi:prepilin-type N-terminal cleavage/methylation domain-containing protein